jgi:hypothetical protein
MRRHLLARGLRALAAPVERNRWVADREPVQPWWHSPPSRLPPLPLVGGGGGGTPSDPARRQASEPLIFPRPADTFRSTLVGTPLNPPGPLDSTTRTDGSRFDCRAHFRSGEPAGVVCPRFGPSLHPESNVRFGEHWRIRSLKSHSSHSPEARRDLVEDWRSPMQ